MSFYSKVLIYSFFFVTAMGAPNVKMGSTSALDAGALLECKDVVLDPNSTTPQKTSCFKGTTPNVNPPADDPTTSASGSAAITFGSLAFIGPVCEDNIVLRGGPGLIHATTLCESLPENYIIQQAYSSTSCACYVWSVGTAAFAKCNCNACEEVDNTGDALYALCWNIFGVCIETTYKRGYYTYLGQSVYWTLYTTGGMIDDDVPLCTSC